MDQSILRAIVAPTKLAWKSQLGKDLISTYGIEEAMLRRMMNGSIYPISCVEI